MPDNSTEKKLTFVEWVAKDGYSGDLKYAEKALETITNNIMYLGIHSGDCTNECHTCTLCLLEKLLSEYHKYFKNK